MRTDQITFPQVLKKARYRTGFVGKLHLGYGPYTKDERYGFDYLAAYNCNHNYYKGHYFENESSRNLVENRIPEKETDLAIKFIENH